jgi:hypothetical protein
MYNKFYLFLIFLPTFYTFVSSLCGIYSVIRCTGSDAENCIRRQYKGDSFGMYGIQQINDRENDKIIWFTTSHDDSGDNINEEYLLNKLQELSGGEVYDDAFTTTNTFKPISGTIKC